MNEILLLMLWHSIQYVIQTADPFAEGPNIQVECKCHVAWFRKAVCPEAQHLHTLQPSA